MRKCPRCSSEKFVKNGIHLETQRYRCKPCGYQFTRRIPRGRSAKDKALAKLLYAYGVPLKTIARLLGVTPPAIALWVKPLAEKCQTAQNEEESKLLDLDEILLFLDSRKGRERSRTLVIAFEVESLTANTGILFPPLAQKNEE